MWESYRRRRPRQVASAKACTHQTWHVRIWQITTATGMQHQLRPALISRGVCAAPGHQRPWPARIGQRQAKSAKACSHKLWCVRIWQTTSANSMQHACTYQPWPLRIGWSKSVVTCAHRPTAGKIGQGLHASTMVFTPRLGDIDRDLRASARQSRPNDRHHQLRPTRI